MIVVEYYSQLELALSIRSIIVVSGAGCLQAAWAWAVSQSDDSTTWHKLARWVEDGHVWTSAGVTAGVCVCARWILGCHACPACPKACASQPILLLRGSSSI
jgi:hypothetical protein